MLAAALFSPAYGINELRILVHGFIGCFKRRHLEHMPHPLKSMHSHRHIGLYHLLMQHNRIV